MAGAPQFDLFAGAKGFEYAHDRNVQDQDNEFKTRRNEMELGAFERQLKEHEEGAALRRQTRENLLAAGKNTALTTEGTRVGLQGQADYLQQMKAAQATFTPAQLSDTSVTGDLDRALATQRYMQQNGASPEAIMRHGANINAIKSNATAWTQDPESMNDLYKHELMGGGKIRIMPVDGAPGRFQLTQRVPQGPGNPDAFVPYPNSVGSFNTLQAQMQSMFVNNKGSTYGDTVGKTAEKVDYDRKIAELARARQAQVDRAGVAAKQQTDQTNQEHWRSLERSRLAQDYQKMVQGQYSRHQAQANNLHKQLAATTAALAKAIPKGDINELNVLRAQAAKQSQDIVDHSAAQAALPPIDTMFDVPTSPAQKARDAVDDGTADGEAAVSALDPYRKQASALSYDPETFQG